MLAGSKIIEPNPFGMNSSILGCIVKKHYIRLHTLCIEDPGGQAKDSVHIAILQELPPDLLSCPSFAQNIIGQHHGRLAVSRIRKNIVCLDLRFCDCGRRISFWKMRVRLVVTPSARESRAMRRDSA